MLAFQKNGSASDLVWLMSTGEVLMMMMSCTRVPGVSPSQARGCQECLQTTTQDLEERRCRQASFSHSPGSTAYILWVPNPTRAISCAPADTSCQMCAHWPEPGLSEAGKMVCVHHARRHEPRLLNAAARVTTFLESRSHRLAASGANLCAKRS